MKLRWLLPGVLIGWQIGAGAEETNAPVSAAEIESLRQQVQALGQKVDELERRQGGDTGSNGVQQLQELDQKIRIVQRQRELDQENADAAAKSVSRLSIGADGFKASSADTNFVLVIHGLVQVDSRTFPDDGGIRGNDGFILRRARPIIQGTVFRNFDFVFVPDFGGNTVQVQDAFVNYRYRPELQLQAGKFKSPVGLEALQPDPAAAFNERSLVTDLVPNRDLGFELHGDLFGGAASYAIGIFNGAPDYSGTTTNSDFEDDKALAARIFLQPWKASDVAALQGLGFGVGGSWEVVDGATNTVGTGLTPGFTTDGQEKFFSYSSGVYAHGTHWRVSPQACYYYGPFGLMGEYVISDQRVSKGSANTDLQNVAWEVTALWTLTGEDASYNGVVPRHPFDWRNNQWGAWQIVGRYATLDVDKKAFPAYANPATAASAAHAWSAGINWYLNRNIRMNASYSHTQFVDGQGGAVTRQAENAVFTRLQLAF